ncbi:MAG TPA: SRPBCC domain-containing protein [Thermoanaerobaculia bacterium]|jgi:uncharacterized protein YndB with AHSA1/START domain
MQTPELSLTLVRTLQAPAQEVFKAWTDPGLLSRWMSIPGGGTASWQVDARVGGQYRMEMQTPDGQVHVTTGVYQELEPGRRLVQTWVYEGPFPDFIGRETLLTVELRELGPSLTELTLKHERLPSEAYQSSVTQGWTALLDSLVAHYVEEPVARTEG